MIWSAASYGNVGKCHSYEQLSLLVIAVSVSKTSLLRDTRLWRLPHARSFHGHVKRSKVPTCNCGVETLDCNVETGLR